MLFVPELVEGFGGTVGIGRLADRATSGRHAAKDWMPETLSILPSAAFRTQDWGEVSLSQTLRDCLNML